ncbi:MAG: hypothetical protein P4L71_00800 [Acetobacteraceae bacterium]|nr:hypothetical protein [Acetobacteraceae bacterium]
MTRRAAVLLLAALAPAPAAAETHVLQCPVVAPREWRLPPPATLAGIDILSLPKGETIDEAAPPALVPDTEDVRGRVLHQSWRMNADGPGWSFFIDCRYAGSARILRFEGWGLRRCDYYVAPYTAARPIQAGAVHKLVCD